MLNFERQIIGEIPLHEAASFFVQMKQPVAFAKTASPVQRMFQRLRNEDMPEGKAGRFKTAGLASPLAKATGVQRFGQLLSGSRAQALGGVAEQQSRSLARAARSASYASSGGPTGNVAHVDPMKHVTNARYRQGAHRAYDRTQRAHISELKSVGATRAGVGGAGILGVAGAAKATDPGDKQASVVDEAVETASQAPGFASQVASKLSKSIPLLADDALMAGRRYYQSQGEKEASARMVKAAQRLKLAFGGGTDANPNMESGQPTPAAANTSPTDVPAPGGSMAPPAGPVQDPEAAKPTTQATLPANYMGAEIVARAAQDANEVSFLRERLATATEQNNALQQQVQQMQEQLQQLQEQSQMAGDNITQATNEAVAASDRALQHSMQAANMRMGIAKMREAMMELASQDPESMGNLAQQQQVQEEQAMAAGQDPAAAGGAAPEQASAGSPAEFGPPTGDGGSGGEGSAGPGKAPGKPGTQVSIKTGSGALPGAIVGGMLGGIQAYRNQGKTPEMEQNVQQLEQEDEQSGSFVKSLELAKARMGLAFSKLQDKHPVMGGMAQVGLGAAGGAALGESASQLGTKFRAA